MAAGWALSKGLAIQPAVEVLPRTSLRALLAAALVALGVVLVCNVAAGRLLEAFPQNRGYQLIKAKWNLLASLTRPVDVLIVGDSSCGLGIDPRVVEAKLGGRALNLCTIGDMTALGSYWMLALYIEKFGPPNTVIVGHAPNVWHRSLSPIVVEQIPVSAAFSKLYSDTTDFRWTGRVMALVARYLPIAADNRSLAELLISPWRAGQRDLTLDSGGFLGVDEANPQRVLEDAGNYRRYVRRKSLEISEENRIAFEKMKEIADKNEFSIYFVHAPLYHGLYSDDKFMNFIGQINDFLADVSAGGFHILNLFPEPIQFSEHDMSNADHVTTAAAAVYTRAIVDAIAASRH